MKVADYNKYRMFNYPQYSFDGKTTDKPSEPLQFDLGDIVYIKNEHSLGVVIGNVDNVRQELRTDQSGIQCFQDLELYDPEKEYKKGRTRLVLDENLFKEIELIKLNHNLSPN